MISLSLAIIYNYIISKMEIMQPIKEMLNTLWFTYIKYCIHFQATITTLSFIMTATLIVYLINDIMTERNEKYIKDEIPEIIELSKNVQNIENYIEQTLEIFPNDLPPIGESITKNIQLTTSQLNFLKFIENLKIYQEKWDTYAYDQLIHVVNIESPYRVAHRIRSLLELPLIMNQDKTDIDVWLTKEEKECIYNYENKFMTPTTSIKQIDSPATPLSETSDHIVICIKCKELISEEEAEKIVIQKHASEVIKEIENKKKVNSNLNTSPMNAINEIAESLNKKINNLKNNLSKNA